jgi:hypothetical protein
MEGSYALYREKGLSEEEAVARTVEKFALSDEALSELVHIHQTALQRLLGSISEQARTRWERILVAFFVCFVFATAGRALITTRLFEQANAYVWPVTVLAAAILALTVMHAGRLYVVRKHDIGNLRRGINWILGLGAASLGTGFAGLTVELYRALLRSIDDARHALVYLIDWALGASATLIVSILLAIIAAVIWFVLVNTVKRIEIAEASWLVE